MLNSGWHVVMDVEAPRFPAAKLVYVGSGVVLEAATC